MRSAATLSIAAAGAPLQSSSLGTWQRTALPQLLQLLMQCPVLPLHLLQFLLDAELGGCANTHGLPSTAPALLLGLS
jgi:hypothetical protein